MQFPRHCVAPRIHIVGIATFADTVESSFNRIACETAASARAACAPPRALRSDGMRVGPLIRTWVRHLARGPSNPRVGPMVRAWAAPWRISRGWRACRGANAHVQRFASDTPGQAPLRPQRRPPRPRHPVVGVCYRGGLRRGRRRPGGVWVFRTVCCERVVLSSPGCLWPGRMDDHEEVLEAHA